jgi:hypothetical protein
VDPGEAASKFAREFGVEVDQAVLLQDTNNIVFWLAPSPVVAKVGSSRTERLERELKTAIALEDASAPIIGPSRLFPRAVHKCQGYDITFWRYVSEVGADLPARAVATALDVLHTALAGIKGTGELPAFSEELDLVEQRLQDPRFAPRLGKADRRLLLGALKVSPGDGLNNVLHGSPHRFNILGERGVVRFIDFETVCRGPIEWDLAHLEPEVAEAYPATFDATTLTRCRLAVSAKTAAWCWDQADQNEAMQQHALHHLELVRQSLG